MSDSIVGQRNESRGLRVAIFGRTRRWCALAALFGGNLMGAAEIETDSSMTERLRRLEEMVAELQRENRTLQRHVASLSSAEAVPVAKPGVSNTAEEPVRRPLIEHSPASTRLRVGGFDHINGEVGDVSSFEGRLPHGPSALSDRFRIRRARLNVSGELKERFDFKLEGDFQFSDGTSGGKTAFAATDLFANWRQSPQLNVKVGQFKAPFGLEQITSDTTLPTIERSLVTGALTPERQIGAQLGGVAFARTRFERRDSVSYTIGVFNGAGRNFSSNDDDHFMVVARAESVSGVTAISGHPLRATFGVNAFVSRDAANTNLSPGLGLALQPDGSLLAFSTHSPDRRRAWGADMGLNWGRADIVAEFLEERIDPVTASPSFSAFAARGHYVQASWFIRPQRLQLVAKFESFDPGQSPHDDIESLTTGLNVYIRGNDLKLMLNHISTRSDFRRANPGLGSSHFTEWLGRLQLLF